MNKTITNAICLALLTIALSLAITACGSNDTDSNDNDDSSKSRQQIEATVGTDVDGRNIDDASFYGTWIGDSEKAQGLFGDLTITFNEDGTYSAVVTGESLSGTWLRDGETITISDPDEILNCTFTYTQKGGLKRIYENTPIGLHR